MLFTKRQQEVLNKFRKEGRKNFTRTEYQHLISLKQRCLDNLADYEEAKKVLIELGRKGI